MNDDPQDVLLRVLPVLRDAHALFSGLPFGGTPESLAVDVRRVLVKVHAAIRDDMANSPYSTEDQLAWDTAMETRIAMDNGSIPFDQDRYDIAKAYMASAMRRSIAQDRKAEPRPRRVSKH